MAFMRDLFYWHGQAQPRTQIVKGKPVTTQSVAPDALAAILKDGSVVVIEMADEAWHEKGSAIPSADIIGTAFRNRQERTWSGTFTGLHGNAMKVKEELGRTFFSSAEDCGRHALARYLEAFNAELEVLADPARHLERELKSHDWHCAMSDAPGVCGAGERHMQEIRKLMGDVDPATARELWTKYAPDGFAFPV
jgi:hypothetical protein